MLRTISQSRESLKRASPGGITLLEVLIAMGILSVGLMSVAALMPAGKSQASKAVVLDRAAVVAANALADAATFGLLHLKSLTPPPTGTAVIDVGLGINSVIPASLRQFGIYDAAAPAAPASVHRLFLQSRDDLVLTPPTTEDDWPTTLMLDDVRAFEGRMTCLLVIRTGTPGKVSAVVFHNRDMTATTISGTLSNGEAQLTGPLGDRSLKELLKVGAVIYAPTPTANLHQITGASLAASGSTAFLTLSTGTAATIGSFSFQLLPDSVGLAEKVFWPETSGPYLE